MITGQTTDDGPTTATIAYVVLRQARLAIIKVSKSLHRSGWQ